jgi:hypothetical protein
LIQAVSLAAISLILLPILASAGILTSRIHNPGLFYQVLSISASAVFLAWIIASAVFGLPLSWTLDLSPLLSLPVSFTNLFLFRTVFGMAGLPFLAGLLFVALLFGGISNSISSLVLCFLAVALTVVAGNSAVSIASLSLRKASSTIVSSLFLLLAFGVGNYMVFQLLAGQETASIQSIAALKKYLLHLDAARFLLFFPSGLFARIASQLRTESGAAALPWLCGLSLETACLVILDWAVSRYHYLVRALDARTSCRTAADLRALSLLDALTMPFIPDASDRALFVKDLLSVWRIKYLRVMALFTIPYLFFFILMMPEMSYVFTLALLTMPAFFFSAFKGNLLGPDCTAMKAVLSSPYSLLRILVSKSRAINVLFWAFCFEAALALAAKRSFTGSMVDVLALVAYVAVLSFASDVTAILVSARFPQPINPNKHPGMSGAGANIAFAVYTVAFVLFALLHVFTRHLPTALGCALVLLLPVIAFALRSICYEKWISPYVETQREHLLSTLAPSIS